jgi:UDP-glucose 4-epimerase
VAAANIAAASAAAGVAGAFNIGSATRITINDLAAMMQRLAGREVGVEYAPPRPGDVRDSLAATAAARAAFGFSPTVGLDEGLADYLPWIAHDPVTLRRLAETHS